MSDINSSKFWDTLYKNNLFQWDLGAATPAFEHLLAEGSMEPGKLLVLGAGYGHDARLFSRSGFDVTAVDFAAHAVEAMRQLQDPHFPIDIIQVDFFELPPNFTEQFDYILDYTSFCAILPQRRSEYADVVTRLLKKDSTFIMLAFPIGTRSGGPPYVVQPDNIIELFSERGFDLWKRQVPVQSAGGRAGYEELLILKKHNP